MRKDTLLVVLGFVVIAVVTYFVLDNTLERAEPQLASVTPEEPPVVEQADAASSSAFKEAVEKGLPAGEEGEAVKEELDAEATEEGDENNASDTDTAAATEESADNDAETEAEADATVDESSDANDSSVTADEPAESSEADVMANAEESEIEESGTIDANVEYAEDTSEVGDEASEDNAEPTTNDSGDSATTESASSDSSESESTSTASSDDAPESSAESSTSSASTDSEESSSQPQPEKIVAEPAKKGDKVVSTSVVNVRAEANTSSDIVGQVELGEIVTLASDGENRWAQIEREEGAGWVYLPLFRYPVGEPKTPVASQEE